MATQKPNDPPDRRLKVYLSPYEYWNFGAGKLYAFPAMRDNSPYISAFAEFAPPLPDPDEGIKPIDARSRLPTLWRPSIKKKFLPFVVQKPVDYELDSPQALRKLLGSGLARAVDMLGLIEHSFVDISSSRFRVALPVPGDAMHSKLDKPSDPHCEPDGGLRARIGDKRITIIAVIDDGIPFAHRNFRGADGCRTRVEFCWLQSADKLRDQKTVLFGREYTRADIDCGIEQFGDDEDRLYDAVGATSAAGDFGSLLGHHATHGAHVMNLATGYDPAHGEEPPEEIRIIAVQLPNSVSMDTSGFGEDMYILSAFHYIFNRADIIKEMYGLPDDPRLVINFSYGATGGRHDGKAELEAAINELIEMRRYSAPTALVVPAGNTFLNRLHAEIHDVDFHHGGVVELPWRIQPNDRTPSYLELWFWGDFSPSKPFDFTIGLRDTSGNTVDLRDAFGQHQTSLPVGADDPTDDPGDPIRVLMVLNRQDEVIGQISADFDRADGPKGKSNADAAGEQHITGRWRVLIVIAPTEPEDDRLPGADSGKWTVVIGRSVHARLVDYPIHCWIQRATDFESFRSGSRQSYFDDDAYESTRFTPQGDLTEVDRGEKDPKKSLVKRFGSINGLATGCTSLVVGGYRLGAGLGSSLARAQPARYSSAGTLKPDWIDKTVDCSSMSDRSRALPGTISAGVRSGSLSLVQGTSAAAPLVARQLATVFVTADDDCVAAAAGDNYRPLLTGEPSGIEAERRARLGTVLVPPHRQPGVDVDLLV
ncbi:MAG: hypothetical protein QOJ84_4490 [Bradyrhizobium sp.]|jgi:hypothetical protein|nr:hypothetical protein [Bradyrhizobium sp.]